MTDETNPLAGVVSTAETVRPARAKKQPSAMELAIKQVTAIEVSFEKAAAEIVKLAERHKDVVYPVETTKGLEEAKAARMEVRQVRYNIQNAEETGKAPLNTIKASISSRAKQLAAMVLEIEEPIDAQIKAEEKRKADEKAERERVEAEAKKAIDAQINTLRDYVVNCTGMSSADILTASFDVGAVVVDLEVFGERTGEAEQIKARVIEQLGSMYENAKALEEERAQLARLQETLRIEREAEETRRAEAQAAESKRLAEERAANEKAAQDLAAQRAAFQKEQDDARAAKQAEEDAARARQQKAEDAERARAESSRRLGLLVEADMQPDQPYSRVEVIDSLIETVNATETTPAVFGDFLEMAIAAKTDTLGKLAAQRATLIAGIEAQAERVRQERIAEEQREAAELKARDAAPIMVKALRAAHHMLTRDPIDDAKMAVITEVSDAIELATGNAPF